MKFRSIFSFSPELRTNAILGLILGIIFSLHSLISSVRIIPDEKVKAIWNTQTLFVTCQKTGPETRGNLKWYTETGPVEDNNRAPIYAVESQNSAKLYLMNAPKKSSGIFECRHYLEGKVVNSDKFELKVYTAINMDGNKDSHVGIEGQPFSMPCLARFDADSTEAQISWIHNNLPIKEHEGQFTVNNQLTQSVTQKNVKSVLSIKHLTKENEGIYVCEAVYANTLLTDIKTIDINLRVQFKPLFPENTRKNVWISDAPDGAALVVNVTCLVNADPVAEFQWLSGHGVPIQNSRLPVKHQIYSTENLSILSLEFDDLNQIRNNFKDPDGFQRKFQCKARNVIGEAKMTFELNIGQLPEPPVLDKYSYENGILVLSVNETEVEPPIDIYRLDIDGNHQIYFNASNRNPLANNTYEIIVDVPTGTHQLIIYAHNPVGWSESNNPNPALQLVISSASSAQQYLTLFLLASSLAAVNAL